MAKTETGPDAVAQFERVTEVAGKAQQMMLEFWTGEGGKLAGEVNSPDSLGQLIDVWGDWAKAWAGADATQLVKLTGDYWTDAMKLWAGLFLGKPESVPDIVLAEDKRFKGDSWESAPVFDLVRKSYLLASHYVGEGLGTFQNLTDEERKRLSFQAKQFVDAMSPANFATLNPDVIAAAQATDGESLLKGLRHLLDDLKRGKMSMTDEGAFEVGRNVAATPGQVIWEGRLFQLIHYAPTTETVFETPLLILPPWINKFYILDLTPEKSFIRWAVEQGLSVYVVSWAQGSEALKDVGLEDYAVEGELQAIDLVLKASGAQSTHVIGYCVAGTVLAATLAYMAATGQAEKVASATFFTAQVEFSDAGDLLNFVTPSMLETVDQLAAKDGYLDGRWLSTTFNMLRPTDLLWNYVVNNYLQGKDYSAFDLLYWNSDPTNVPGRFMTEYLAGLYRDNKLVVPDALEADGTPIDLTSVATPSFVQAGREDHIAPAESVWRITKHFTGPVDFLLAGSGHIAGVVNPPSAGKYQYWVGDSHAPSLKDFIAGATEHPGSWWPHWLAWLHRQSEARVPATGKRMPGGKGDRVIEDAPGRYVKTR